MTTAYLKLDHIGKTFARGAQKTEVLRDIRLTIDKGEFVSIIGHSGCGKSTLLNLVAGLGRVTTGAVLLDRTPEDEHLPEEIRKAIETTGDRICDLHVWQVGPGHHAAIVSLVSNTPRDPAHYKARLARIAALSHITVEVQPGPQPA